MRPIDADALKKDLTRFYDNEVTARELIDEQPTIEAITRERYHEMTERFLDEFVDNGANEVTVANCMLIGLAFGKLELMLFGGNEDGDSE